MTLQLPLVGSYSSAFAVANSCNRLSACDQHHAVGQQGRRVLIASGVEAARGTPAPARRVVQFRARESITLPAVIAPPATSTMPFGSKVAVCR